ncbi:MAG: peptide chain release factor N(5)-glutamine methyltransferase [Pseudomonadota bacterium]
MSETTALEADLLLMHVLKVSRAALLAAPERILSATDITLLDTLVERRRDDVPLAYITGSQPFWSLDLCVNSATLVPRADTETLVEQALVRVAHHGPSRVADLGTGSGAIALAIACERPDATIIASDTSPAALDVARDNAQRHDLRNVSFCASHWLDNFDHGLFDVIVSNPPYVESGYAELERSLRHEPRVALASGADGLDDIRHIVAQAPAYLASGGWLLLEHGNEQAVAVSGILRAADFCEVSTYLDLAGNPRVTEARFTR